MPNKRLDRGVSGSGSSGETWGDLGLDLGRDRADRARVEPENNILRLQITRVKVVLN